MPNVIDYQGGPDEAARQAARQISASRRESLVLFAMFLLIVAVTVLYDLSG